jgi:hypothetical protein
MMKVRNQRSCDEIVAILELIRGAQCLIEVIGSSGEEMWRVDAYQIPYYSWGIEGEKRTMSKLDSYSSRSHFFKLPLTNMVATSDSCNRNYSAILATLQITSYVDSNRQTSGESASLPQYLSCNTVFDMRLRVFVQ